MFVLLEKYDAEEGAMPIKAFAEEGAMETALVSHRQIDKKLLFSGSCIQRLSQIHKVSSMTPSMTPRRRRLNDLELNDLKHVAKEATSQRPGASVALRSQPCFWAEARAPGRLDHVPSLGREHCATCPAWLGRPPQQSPITSNQGLASIRGASQQLPCTCLSESCSPLRH